MLHPGASFIRLHHTHDVPKPLCNKDTCECRPRTGSSPALTELAGGWSGGRADGCGRGAGLDPPEHGLPAVPAMGPGAGRFGGFLPVVIEGDQLPLRERRASGDEGLGDGFSLPCSSLFCQEQELLGNGCAGEERKGRFAPES